MYVTCQIVITIHLGVSQQLLLFWVQFRHLTAKPLKGRGHLGVQATEHEQGTVITSDGRAHVFLLVKRVTLRFESDSLLQLRVQAGPG